MKLCQGQVWNVGDQFLRIVVLERLSVEYKALPNLQTKDGTHHQVTKKQFCTLIKHGTLVPRVTESNENN